MAFLPQDEGGGGAPSGGGGTGGGGGRGGGGGMGGVTFSSEIELTVRWATALPIKQAKADLQYGKEAGSPDAAKLLDREEKFYVAEIEGYPGTVTAEDVKAGSQLIVKGIPPIQSIQVDMGQANAAGRGSRGAGIFLVFPKGQKDAHVLKVDEGEIEVVVNAPGLKLKRKFKLKDMVFNGKLEI
jgi:hypothetical protein